MKTIPLTKGAVAIVDDRDYPAVSRHKWYLCSAGYAARQSPRVNGKQRQILMHREIFGTPPGMETDHRDGNKLNNRRRNLREATDSQTCMNRRGWGKFPKGVSAHKQTGKFVGMIHAGGKRHYLGLFPTPDLAHAAYNDAARELHGEFRKAA